MSKKSKNFNNLLYIKHLLELLLEEEAERIRSDSSYIGHHGKILNGLDLISEFSDNLQKSKRDKNAN